MFGVAAKSWWAFAGQNAKTAAKMLGTGLGMGFAAGGTVLRKGGITAGRSAGWAARKSMGAAMSNPLTRKMMGGAAIGGLYGIGENVVGEDRISALEGMGIGAAGVAGLYGLGKIGKMEAGKIARGLFRRGR